MRANEKCREASLFRADGVVKHEANPHSETLWQIDHPGRSIRGGFAHFLLVASTPPHEEGISHSCKRGMPALGNTSRKRGEYSQTYSFETGAAWIVENY